MFRPIPAIIRFSSERVLAFIRFMWLCDDGEISSSVPAGIPHRTAATKAPTRASHATSAQYLHYKTPPPPLPATSLSSSNNQKNTDDEISPSLHNRIKVINTNTLSGENLMMAGIGRNM